MASRDIIDHLLRRKKPSRMGVHELFWPETFPTWLEQGYPTDKNEKGETVPVDHIEHFGLDMRDAAQWLDPMPNQGFMETVEETDEWISRRNGAGAVLKYWKHKSGTPEHVDFRMTSREVWERDYRSLVDVVDRSRVDIEGTKKGLALCKEKGSFACFGHTLVWETMRASLGDICMFESMALDPEWIHDYCRVYTDYYKNHYRILLEEAGKPDGVWIYEDLGYRNGLFCSPKTMDELIFPYYRDMVSFYHSYDIPVVLHSCGNVTEGVKLIAEAGFDGLHPMEVKAGCDIFKFAEEYGDQLTFIGGLDVRILETGDRDTIKSGILRIINGMKSRGARYVFGSDHSIPPTVKYEDYKYALEVYRDNCEY